MGKPTGLAKEQYRALGRLKAIPGLKAFYLAGGSAIGFHLGHRRSHDLDLFSMTKAVNLAKLRRQVVEHLPDVAVLSTTDATLRLRLGAIPVDIVCYPYALLDFPGPGPEAFPVAGLRDLAAMKLATIAGRGLRRDFWDLYVILQNGMALADAVQAYRDRFGLSEPELYHLARSLTYFADGEKDASFPQGLTKKKWEAIKAFFQDEAPKLVVDAG